MLYCSSDYAAQHKRSFDGKSYKPYGFASSKTSVIKDAAALRKNKHLVRVVKVGKLWSVYYR